MGQPRQAKNTVYKAAHTVGTNVTGTARYVQMQNKLVEHKKTHAIQVTNRQVQEIQQGELRQKRPNDRSRLSLG